MCVLDCMGRNLSKLTIEKGASTTQNGRIKLFDDNGPHNVLDNGANLIINSSPNFNNIFDCLCG